MQQPDFQLGGKVVVAEPMASPAAPFRSSFAREMAMQCKRSSQHAVTLIPSKCDDDSEWLSSDQFVKLLEHEEQQRHSFSDRASSSSARQDLSKRLASANASSALRSRERSAGSLAEDALVQVPSAARLNVNSKMKLTSLKQTCDDLGFTLCDSDWQQLRGQFSISETSDLVNAEQFFEAIQHLLKSKDGRKQQKHAENNTVIKNGYSVDAVITAEQQEPESCDSGLLSTSSSTASPSCKCEHEFLSLQPEVMRLRMECLRLAADNRLATDAVITAERRTDKAKRLQAEMEKEMDRLRCKMSQLEANRATYVMATERLVSFLEQVTSALSASSASAQHAALVESTRAEVTRIGRRNNRMHSKRLSMDSVNSTVITRAESLPGLSGVGVAKRGEPEELAISASVTNVSSLGKKRCGAGVQRSQSTQSRSRASLPLVAEDVSPYENLPSLGVLNEVDETKECVRTRLQKRHSFSAHAVNVVSLSSSSRRSEDKDSGRGSCSSGRSTPNALGASTEPTETREDGCKEPAATLSDLRSRAAEPTARAPKEAKAPSPSPPSASAVGVGDTFRSLGNLHMEPALPEAPISYCDVTEAQLLSTSQRLMKSVRSLLSRERTLSITPKKAKSWRPADSMRRHSSGAAANKQQPLLLSHTSFPGLPAFPVLAASHSSPWNC